MSVKRVGIIGCGRIFRKHFDAINLHSGKFKLVACADLNKKSLNEKVYSNEINKYHSYIDMLSFEVLDVVCILVPSGLHFKIAKDCVDKVKTVVVEKPIALRLSELDALIERSEKANSNLVVVKQNRYNLPVQAALSVINRGGLGKLTLGTIRVRWSRNQEYYDQAEWRGTWQLDGGVITNQASHHLDLLIEAMGPVKSVFAKGVTQLVNIETEDTLVATLEFCNGALGVVEATTAVRPKDLEGSLTVLGSKGSIVIGGFAVNEMVTWDVDPSVGIDFKEYSDFSENPPDVYGYGHQRFYNALHEAILTNNFSNISTGRSTRHCLELIHALYISNAVGKPVNLPISREFPKLGLS